MANTRIYRIWIDMCKRCNNPNATGYKNYGGRSIKVCDKWNKSFIAFYKDMGPSYEEGLTIERKENDKNYEPSNCCWATRKEQANNRRHSNTPYNSGVKNPKAKLTEQNIYAIRQLLLKENLTYKEIGAIFNVGTSTICRIKHNTNWRHI